MMKLLKQNIVCLCVHDSFIVISDFQDELVEGMKQAFAEVVKADATLKPAEMPIDGFEVHHSNMKKLCRGNAGSVQHSLQLVVVQTEPSKHRQDKLDL